ncbi:hypothetical protein [Anaerovorax sp. IOR16]|uniref:hypothetical protein n=1 Tax=Anaerovorax sp. IOR16 TaxID=2773458 RepID=UPI0019D31244|nr:hypothetical protein [Anaerovorax sp. IOR16]
MRKVACSKKELSCLISNLFSELSSLCDGDCRMLSPDDFVISGKLIGLDEIATVKITEYGCEYFGNEEVLDKILATRCLKIWNL